MHVTIRPYESGDLPRLREIAVDAFQGVSIDQAIEQEFGAINGRDWRWRKARHIDDDVVRDAEGTFVAVDPSTGEVIGFVTSWSDREAGIGMIPNLSIADGRRGQGIGRRLLQHTLDHFRRQGLTHARIETLAHNEPGYGLYTSLGFKEVTRQVHFAMDLSSSAESTQGEPNG